MFKALVGRGHPEFSTNRQQDAQEFLLHFINMVEVKFSSCPVSLISVPSSSCYSNISFIYSSFFFFLQQRNCRSGPNPSEAFKFLVEEKIVCQQSQKAKYTGRVDYIIQLPVPMDQATNAGIRLRVAANARRPVSASTYPGGEAHFWEQFSGFSCVKGCCCFLSFNRRTPGSRAPA